MIVIHRLYGRVNELLNSVFQNLESREKRTVIGSFNAMTFSMERSLPENHEFWWMHDVSHCNFSLSVAKEIQLSMQFIFANSECFSSWFCKFCVCQY